MRGKPTESTSETKPEDTTPMDLGTFIEDNYRLFAVLGVLTALTVFAASIQLRTVGVWLSSAFLAADILVWFELWRRFPPKMGTWQLFWFENVMSWATLGLIAYWLLEYRLLWRALLPLPIAGVILAVFSWVMKRWDVFNRLFRAAPGQRKALRSALATLVMFVVFMLAVLLAGVISWPINNWLDSVRTEMEQSAPNLH